MGPIVWWSQSIAFLEILPALGIGASLGEYAEPLNPVVDYSGFWLMVTAWLVSAFLAAKVWSSRFSGELREIVRFRYLIPFVGAWACTLALLGYLRFLVD